MTTPKGVRMVNENIVQEGRAFLLTDIDEARSNWANIPPGSLYVNPVTGLIQVKLEGETDWVPAGLKNDGTLVISRDTAICAEVFTVTSLGSVGNNFTYKNSKGEQRYKLREADGYIFELDNGTYYPGRNHLTVTRNKTTEYSAATGDIVELDPRRFKLKVSLAANDKLVVRYIKWVRIGNPYPRVFESAEEPVGAEIGDIWIDLDGTIEGLEDVDEDSQDIVVSWNNITGKPNTLAGYGIVNRVAAENHTHTSAQITDLNGKLTELQTSISTTKTTLENKDTALQNQINTINGNISAIQTDITTKNNALQASITTTNNNLNAVATELRNADTTIQSSITALNNKDTTLQNSINTLASKDTELQNSITALINKDTTLQNSINTLASKDTELQNSITALNNKDTTLQNSINTLASKDTELQSSITALSTNLSSVQSQVSSSNTNIQGQIDDIQAQINNLPVVSIKTY